MNEKTIVYEHPLNERMRNILRLEMLLHQAGHVLSGDSIWDSRNYIAALMEILDLFGRIDLKTELIKELERAAANLARHGNAPQADDREAEIERLGALSRKLHGMPGQLGYQLRSDPLLAMVRQRSMLPGGTSGFDLPRLHRWLHQPREERVARQHRWHESLSEVQEASRLLLELLRGSAELEDHEAEDGVYQGALKSGVPYQIVRVFLPRDAPWFVEVSGGRHLISIRFMEVAEGSRAVQSKETIPFRLATCAL